MKSNRALFAAVTIFSAACSFAQSPAASGDRTFAEFDAFIAARDRQMRSESWRTTPSAKRERITFASAEQIATQGERILAEFPSDPRRWEAIRAMVSARRAFDGADAAARQTAWEKRVAELCTLTLAAADASPAAIEAAAGHEVMTHAFRSTRTPDLPRALRALERLADKVPASNRREVLESVYLDALKTDEAAYVARLQQLGRDNDKGVVTLAKNRLNTLALKTTPVELKFPDLDGREIDLAKYRGKVVLLDFWATWCAPCMVDFWATWCVPCIEGIPKLKTLYARYHDQGLEIVNISVDNANARPALEKLVAKLEIPWPQFFDGEAHATEYAVRYGVQPIPHVLLAGPDGKIVAVNPTPEKLEAEIKRLLKL